MNFLIVTHVEHGKDGSYFAYAPYVREMNIWNKYASEVVVVAPLGVSKKNDIHLNYDHSNLIFKKVKSFNFLNIIGISKSLLAIPTIMITLYREMRCADHIHLRCPGNVGLLGCIMQMFFPSKIKTAKYAGNWDPNSKQPLSYKFQKWLLSSTMLTKNMQVLVYGEWDNQTKNVKSFFTASYFEKDKLEIRPKTFTKIRLLFVGTLSPGKRPMYAVTLLHRLVSMGHNITLDMYGEGIERNMIEDYIDRHDLAGKVVMHGNQSDEVLREAYQKSHFLVLPSKSEGWPKAVAEAMFWGCVPLATSVSCIPYMLDWGNRGELLTLHINSDAEAVIEQMEHPQKYSMKVDLAAQWSRHFTLDLLAKEISSLMNVVD